MVNERTIKEIEEVIAALTDAQTEKGCRHEPWTVAYLKRALKALQSANPTTDETKSVPNEGTIVPNLGTEDGGYISTTNDEVLSRIAEAESDDLPHIKLKDEARGEGDGERLANEFADRNDVEFPDVKDVFLAGYRSRDGEVAGLYKELAAHKSELWKAAHAVKRFSSKLDRMEKALREIEAKEGMCIFGSADTSDDPDVAFRQGSAYSNNECAEIARQALQDTDEKENE